VSAPERAAERRNSSSRAPHSLSLVQIALMRFGTTSPGQRHLKTWIATSKSWASFFMCITREEKAVIHSSVVQGAAAEAGSSTLTLATAASARSYNLGKIAAGKTKETGVRTNRQRERKLAKKEVTYSGSYHPSPS
jgi:hypothetical protein